MQRMHDTGMQKYTKSSTYSSELADVGQLHPRMYRTSVLVDSAIEPVSELPPCVTFLTGRWCLLADAQPADNDDATQAPFRYAQHVYKPALCSQSGCVLRLGAVCTCNKGAPSCTKFNQSFGWRQANSQWLCPIHYFRDHDKVDWKDWTCARYDLEVQQYKHDLA